MRCNCVNKMQTLFPYYRVSKILEHAVTGTKTCICMNRIQVDEEDEEGSNPRYMTGGQTNHHGYTLLLGQTWFSEPGERFRDKRATKR